MAEASEKSKLQPPPYNGGVVGTGPGNVPYQQDQPPPYYSTGGGGRVAAAPGWGYAQSVPPPPPNYGSTTGIGFGEPVLFPATQVIIVGGCPACRVGVLEDEFSCLGILCALFFFPIGILCCLALRDKRCTNCGAIF